MKKFIISLITIVLFFTINIVAFATPETENNPETPVEFVLTDVYDLKTMVVILKDENEKSHRLLFTATEEYKATTSLAPGIYEITDCEYEATDKTEYSIDLEGATFEIPKSASLKTIELKSNQKPKGTSFLDYLKASKVPIIVLIVCGVVYVIITKREKQNKKPVNPEVVRMLEEHEAMQEFYQSDKINISQYDRNNNDVSFDNEYADNEEYEEDTE